MSMAFSSSLLSLKVMGRTALPSIRWVQRSGGLRAAVQAERRRRRAIAFDRDASPRMAHPSTLCVPLVGSRGRQAAPLTRQERIKAERAQARYHLRVARARHGRERPVGTSRFAGSQVRVQGDGIFLELAPLVMLCAPTALTSKAPAFIPNRLSSRLAASRKPCVEHASDGCHPATARERDHLLAEESGFSAAGRGAPHYSAAIARVSAAFDASEATAWETFPSHPWASTQG